MVGPQKFRFNVHKNVLCQAPAGSFFQKVFGGGGFKEAKQLPEDGPNEVQFFVDSLYRAWTGNSEAPDAFDCVRLELSQEIKLYVFAQRYACRDLQNAIISDLLDYAKGIYWTDADFFRQDLEYLDHHLPDTTPMHRLLSLWFIRDVLEKDMLEEDSEAIAFTDGMVNDLPDFLVRAALEHVIRSRHLDCTNTSFEEQDFMVPGDSVMEK